LPPPAILVRVGVGIQLLGPLAIDGEPLAARRRERVLFAALALDAGQAVGLTNLEDWLWPDGAEGDHRRQVQVCLSRLRRVLRELPLAIELISSGSTYELRVPPGSTDADRVEDLLEQARSATLGRRLDLLDEALRLWRGDVLADLPELGVHPGVARLQGLYDVVLEQWADAALDAGQAQRVATRLDVVDVHELPSERSVGHLVLALYRSGRPLDALDRTTSYARWLREERGLDPGPELQQLELGLLTHDGSLNGPLGPKDRGRAEIHEVRRHLLAELGDDGAVLGRERAAAEDALRARSYAEAALHFEAALGRCPADDPSTRFELLAGLADARRRASDHSYQDVLVEMADMAEQASGSVATDRRVKVALTQREVGWHGVCGEPDPELAAYRAALEPLDESDPRWPVVAADIAGVIHHTPREGTRVDWFRRALVAARELDDDVVLRRVLADAIVLDDADLVVERQDLAAELLERTIVAGDLEGQHFGHRIALLGSFEQGDLGGIEHHWEGIARTAEELRQPAFRWSALAWSASVELHRGRLASAEERAHRAFTWGIEGGIEQTRTTWMFSGQLGEVRRLQGRFGELAEMITVAAVDDVDHHPYAPWRAAVGLALIALGRLDEAEATMHEVLAERFPFQQGQGWTAEALCVIETAAALGDADVARRVYDAIVDRPQPWMFSGAAGGGPMGIPLGVAARAFGDGAAARGHFEQAARLADAAGAPVYAAQARALLASVMLEAGDGSERRRGVSIAALARQVGEQRGAGLVVALADQAVVLATR
jgi:DNA-binding SARP family transcriptional activator